MVDFPFYGCQHLPYGLRCSYVGCINIYNCSISSWNGSLDHYVVSFLISVRVFIYLFIYLLFIYLFLAVLGLCCCMPSFSSCGEWGLLFIAVCRLLLLSSMGSRCVGFSSYGTWAQQFWLTGSTAQAQ